MTRAQADPRDVVTSAALDLLDEVGLDAVSTRRLAQRLGVEQPSLYWHFPNKSELLAAMAEAAMAPHARAPLPRAGRRLAGRGSARTPAACGAPCCCTATAPGSTPGPGRPSDLDRIRRKLAFLVDGGIPGPVAQMAMLAAGRFTVGSVLEEQADLANDLTDRTNSAVDHEAAFEAGLGLLSDGLARHRTERTDTALSDESPSS